MSAILPDRLGHYFFSADNKSLIGLFHTLGIKILQQSMPVSQVNLPSWRRVELAV